MASIEINDLNFPTMPGADIRAEIRDWMTDGGPTWEPMAMHGAWLRIGILSFAFPGDPAGRLAILERLADTVETLVVDARAQMDASEQGQYEAELDKPAHVPGEYVEAVAS